MPDQLLDGGVKFPHLFFGFSEAMHEFDNQTVKEDNAVVFEYGAEGA